MLQQRIEQKLSEQLQPTWLEVENESAMHHVPPGSESHFKVTIVSPAFAHKSLVQRHRMVYAALGEEMRGAIHALTIASQTPEEWEHHPSRLASPACSGGSKHA